MSTYIIPTRCDDDINSLREYIQVDIFDIALIPILTKGIALMAEFETIIGDASGSAVRYTTEMISGRFQWRILKAYRIVS